MSAINTEMMKFMPLVSAIAEQMNVEKATLNDEQKEHNKEVTDTLAGKLREYATAVHADGKSGKDAGDFIRMFLALSQAPKGTTLAYGRAVEGFHKLLTTGTDISKASTVDAQKAMRSEEQVERDLIRDQLKLYLRDGTIEQLRAINEYAGSLGIVVKERKQRSDKASAETQVEVQARAA